VLDYLRRLAESNSRALQDPDLTRIFYLSQKNYDREIRDDGWATRVTRITGVLNRELARSAQRKLQQLEELWAQDRGPITGNEQTERGLHQERPLDKYELENSTDRIDWNLGHDRMAMEEFVALLYLGYIRMVLLQIRTRIMTATAMYILLLWALTSYPFLNHHSIVIGLSCLLAGLSTAVSWIYSQMHLDDILNRTTETHTGKLGADFFTKILSMVGIPLLTLVASQFPEISNVVFSWLEPGLSSVK